MSDLSDGFVAIPRSALLAMDEMSPLQAKLYAWMLRRANFRDRGQLMQGQLITTIDEMRAAMSHHAGWKKVIPTPDQIRTAYGALTASRRNPARITVQRTTRGMVITVLDYCAFNNDDATASRQGARQENAREPGATPPDTEQIEQEKRTIKNISFIPPKTEEVQGYMESIGFKCDAQRFIDHYASNGWMVGKNKMKDWKAAVRTWRNNDRLRSSSSTSETGRKKGIPEPGGPDTDWFAGYDNVPTV